jgi:hypothetical protein
VADLLIIHCSDRGLHKPIRRSISNALAGLDAPEAIEDIGESQRRHAVTVSSERIEICSRLNISVP